MIARAATPTTFLAPKATPSARPGEPPAELPPAWAAIADTSWLLAAQSWRSTLPSSPPYDRTRAR